MTHQRVTQDRERRSWTSTARINKCQSRNKLWFSVTESVSFLLFPWTENVSPRMFPYLSFVHLRVFVQHSELVVGVSEELSIARRYKGRLQPQWYPSSVSNSDMCLSLTVNCPLHTLISKRHRNGRHQCAKSEGTVVLQGSKAYWNETPEEEKSHPFHWKTSLHNSPSCTVNYSTQTSSHL